HLRETIHLRLLLSPRTALQRRSWPPRAATKSRRLPLRRPSPLMDDPMLALAGSPAPWLSLTGLLPPGPPPIGRPSHRPARNQPWKRPAQGLFALPALALRQPRQQGRPTRRPCTPLKVTTCPPALAAIGCGRLQQAVTPPPNTKLPCASLKDAASRKICR